MKGGVALGAATTTVSAVMLGMLAGYGLVHGHLIAIAVVWLLLAYLAGRAASTDIDNWLPRLMVVAMVVKLTGSWIRLYVLQVVYDGSGDAGRYHNFGLVIADTWRDLQVPDLATVGFGGEGTRFVAWATGLLYAPYEPTMLGGFWIFSLLAFAGQFFFYIAFRMTFESPMLRKYALLIFLWPSFVYWPSSIGKEAMIMPFLGLGSWAAACLYRRYQLRWLPVVALSAGIIYVVRVHVAALFVGALLAGSLLGRRQPGIEVASRRMIIGLIALLSLSALVLGVGEQFNLDLSNAPAIEDLDPVFSDVGDTTGQGGSAVSGGVIRSPADIPAGVLKVLFRPLPNEAGNLPMLAASLEGVMLLALVLWRLPKMLGNFARIRARPYLMFCAVYSVLFVWAWSSVLNLGILARQRVLVLPFILALVIGLGWPTEDDVEDVDASEQAQDRLYVS